MIKRRGREREGEDGDVGESSSEHPTDETLPIAQFDLTIDNP